MMDHHPPREEDFVIEVESGTGVIRSIEDEQKDFTKLCENLMNADDNLVKVSNGCSENIVKVVIDLKMEGEDLTGKKVCKEKRKKALSAKKPPRPPKGFSLDAADQKLIKELAELAMIRKARIERLKALKQKQALRTSSSSSSSMSGSLFAMLFTIIFFLMILLQGMSCRSSGVTSQSSPQTTQTNENGLIFIQEQLNPSAASDSILPDSKSSNLLEKISGSGSASRKVK